MENYEFANTFFIHLIKYWQKFQESKEMQY